VPLGASCPSASSHTGRAAGRLRRFRQSGYRAPATRKTLYINHLPEAPGLEPGASAFVSDRCPKKRVSDIGRIARDCAPAARAAGADDRPIAKLTRDRLAPSAKRGPQLLEEIELQLEELESDAGEDCVRRREPACQPNPQLRPPAAGARAVARAFAARARGAARPGGCPCCGGQLVKLGEDVTETLEVVPAPVARWSRPSESGSPAGPARRSASGPPLLSDRAGPRRRRPAGDGAARQVRSPPLNRQSDTFARGRRNARLDSGRLGRRLCGDAGAAYMVTRPQCPCWPRPPPGGCGPFGRSSGCQVGMDSFGLPTTRLIDSFEVVRFPGPAPPRLSRHVMRSMSNNLSTNPRTTTLSRWRTEPDDRKTRFRGIP
jgi:transposase